MGKLSFSDSKAKGGFFGLTLLFLVPWLFITLCVVNIALLMMNGWVRTSLIVLLTSVLVAVVAYIYGISLFVRGILANRAQRTSRQWRMLFGGVSALLLGGALLVFLFRRAFVIFGTIDKLCDGRQEDNVMYLPDWLEAMMGGPWSLLFVVLAVGFLVVGYVTLGKVLAASAECDFARLWTKGVRTQWWIMAVIYVASFLLGGCSALGLYRARQTIARAVGRPLTAQALEEYYCNGQQPDAEFWQDVAIASKARIDTLLAAKREKDALPYWQISNIQNAVMSPKMVAQWRKVGMDTLETRDFETFFDNPLPPNVRDYAKDMLIAMRLPEAELGREIIPLECWRVRIAVADRDFVTAQAALRRMKNMSDRLAHDHSMIIALNWGNCEKNRCEALALVIGAGLGDEAWLKELDQEMATLENAIDDIRLNALIYGEAVILTDAADGAWQCAGAFVDGAVPLKSFMWLTPQLWWGLQRFKKLLTQYLASGVDQPLPKLANRHGLMSFCEAYQSSEQKLLEFKANYRMVRALIAIAREKRRSGQWPSQPSAELPEDPFAPGAPLKYQHGTLEVDRSVWNAEKRQFELLTETVKGVRVYSVGKNGRDDGGIRRISTSFDDRALWFPIP